MRHSYLAVFTGVAPFWGLTGEEPLVFRAVRLTIGFGRADLLIGLKAPDRACRGRSRATESCGFEFLEGEIKGKKMRHERCFDRAGRPVTQLVSAVVRWCGLKNLTAEDSRSVELKIPQYGGKEREICSIIEI
jgi:hypothetical protein